MNAKISLSLRKLAVVVFAGCTLPASAGFIDEQQAQLRGRHAVWNAVQIPQGMQNKAPRAKSVRDSGTNVTSLEARDVHFAVTGDIGFHVHHLAASLEPANTGDPADFDDPRQFVIRIHSGEVTVPPKALTALFNEHILDYFGAPLNDLKVTTSDGQLMAKGGARLWGWFPGLWLPLTLTGELVLDDKNQLIYAPEGVKVLGIPLGGLLRTLHIKLSWLLSLDREGALLAGSQLELNHRSVFPPPALSGNIAALRLSEAGLHLTFTDNPAAKFMAPPLPATSYLWIQSGDAKLYDIVVANARILVLPEKAGEPLHFDLYGYRQQVAGGTLYMNEDGLITAKLPPLATVQQTASK